MQLDPVQLGRDNAPAIIHLELLVDLDRQRPAGAPGGPRGPMSGPRPGSVRPGFAARPQRPDQRPGQGGARPGQGAPGSRPQGSGPYRSQPGGAPRPGGFGGPGRPGQRPGAGGAFGKGGGKKKSYKSKKALREEIDNMEAPQLVAQLFLGENGKYSSPTSPRRITCGPSLKKLAQIPQL